MEISINCETFVRLAKVANTLKPDHDKGEYLRSIWLEVEEGDTIAVATNVNIAAIEYLGRDVGPNVSMNVTVDEALINQCITETPFNSKITFTLNSALKFITAKTSLGYVYPSNAGVFTDGKNEFETWREWLPDEMPKKANGGMFSKLDNLVTLASSAPTGSVIFPEKIDRTKPVVVNDVHDENWIGLFIPTPSAGKIPDPVSIPTWAEPL